MMSPEGWAKTLPGYRGVLKGAEKSYANYVRQTYARAHRFYPGAEAKAPPFDFNTPKEDQKLIAYLAGNERVPPGRRPIHFSPRTALAYVNPPSPIYPSGSRRTKNFAQFAPLHELVHEYQQIPSRVTGGTRRRLVEGGAQAFALALAPHLGIPKQTGKDNAEYARLSRAVRRQLGRGFVNVGQFGYGR